MIQTTRKCKYCKELIILEEFDFVLEGVSYFHFNCFIDYWVNKKRGKVSVEEAKVYASELKEGCKESVKDIIDRNHLFKWLQKKYDLVVMPTCVFTKFEAIFKGEYKGMSAPLSPEDLLDMWERKWTELNSLYNYNIGKGKEIDNLGRLNYDTAVILSKSTSYFKWKQNQVITDIKKKEIQLENQNKVDYTKLEIKSDDNGKVNIFDILEEI